MDFIAGARVVAMKAIKSPEINLIQQLKVVQEYFYKMQKKVQKNEIKNLI
jgi:hypothetical protein